MLVQIIITFRSNYIVDFKLSVLFRARSHIQFMLERKLIVCDKYGCDPASCEVYVVALTFPLNVWDEGWIWLEEGDGGGNRSE
jgi:hypothetical protein